MQDTAARVLSCETMAQDLVRIILSAPDIAAQAKAGQFIHILVPDSGHVLRRPISLMAADAAAGTLTLAIQPKGAGTQTLCACKPGETIRVLGPLGTGFDGFALADIEIFSDEAGAPHVRLYRGAQARLAEIGALNVMVSISHTKDAAMAVAAAE